MTFSWGPLPAGWQVASDLEHNTPQTIATAQNSLLLGGADVRVVERRTAKGGLLRVASRGAWTFDPAALAQKVAQVGDAQDRFWGEGGKPFLVSLIPLAPGATHSSGGRGLSEAFALFQEPTARLEDFTFLLAHERMHSWISSGLGGLPDDREALDYWLSEGFTDFYAARLLLRSGVWSLEDFAAQENEMLVRYAGSGARNAPNARIQQAFWTDNAMQQLPYDRGRLFATILDHRLSSASHGRLNLDDVMRRQRELAIRNDAAGVTATAAAIFPTVYRSVSGRDLSADLARDIQAGATIELPADLYGACATVKTSSISTFDRGFDGEKSAASGVILGVDPDGPAYAAGLRNGMKRLGREGGKDGNSQLFIAYRVADADGAERVVRYYPAGKAKVTVQKVEIRPGMAPARRSACARSMSGAR
ncbi:hypothetical protein [Phenylobacterium sp.]|uniref:M61 family metallopeptidase n=1 Tax=Phenylobacterium sp. TaxID=1871053 RepID=UPI00374CE158